MWKELLGRTEAFRDLFEVTFFETIDFGFEISTNIHIFYISFCHPLIVLTYFFEIQEQIALNSTKHLLEVNYIHKNHFRNSHGGKKRNLTFEKH